MKAIKKKPSVHPARVELLAGLVFIRDLFTRGDRVHISIVERCTLRALCGSLSRTFTVENYADRQSNNPDRYVCPACYTKSKATMKKPVVEVREKPKPETNSHIERHNAIQAFRSAERKFDDLASRLATTYAKNLDGVSYALHQRAIEARDAIAALRRRIEKGSGQ